MFFIIRNYFSPLVLHLGWRSRWGSKQNFKEIHFSRFQLLILQQKLDSIKNTPRLSQTTAFKCVFWFWLKNSGCNIEIQIFFKNFASLDTKLNPQHKRIVMKFLICYFFFCSVTAVAPSTFFCDCQWNGRSTFFLY